MKTKMMLVLLIWGLVACGVSWNHPVEPSAGPQGETGATGAQGPTGDSSTYPVQFCPGVTPSYPTTFPESGLCISGQVYAVFDQPNGYDYLTLIPPGQYLSEATGASCSFTVDANCQISQ